MCPWHQRPESAPPGSPNYPVPCGRVSRQSFALSPRGFLRPRTCTFLIRLPRVDPLGGALGAVVWDEYVWQPPISTDLSASLSCWCYVFLLFPALPHLSRLHINAVCLCSFEPSVSSPALTTHAVVVYSVRTDLQHWFTVLEAELKGRVSFLGCCAIPPENGLLIKCVLAFLKCYYWKVWPHFNMRQFRFSHICLGFFKTL